MKQRNLVPLLGIAFVVALAASGIFYGVFASQLTQASRGAANYKLAVAARPLDRGTVLTVADLKLSPWAGNPPPGSFRDLKQVAGQTLYMSIPENEPVTEARLSAEKASGGLGISKGMRALSVRVSDSGGLIPLLRAGNRVDVQVVQNRNSPQTALRTILQNVEVLGIQPLPEGPLNQAQAYVVTLLMSPGNADRVALADSGASIRLLLRNSLDDDEGSRPGIALASLFSEREENSVDLLVKVAGAGAKALEEMRSALPALSSQDVPEVSRFPNGAQGDRMWTALEQNVDLLSTSRLRASSLSPAYLRAEPLNGLSIRFEPGLGPNRFVRLRVEPSVGLPSTRMVAGLDLANGERAIVTGLGDAGEKQGAAAKRLIVLVTARLHNR